MAQGNLLGTVVDEKDVALPGTTVTLIGTPTPQAQVTDAQGKFQFDDLPPGTYALSAVLKGHSQIPQPDVIIETDHTSEVEIKMRVESETTSNPAKTDAPSSPSTSLPPLRQPVVQNIALSLIAIGLIFFLYKGLGGISTIDLSNDLAARGLITRLVTVSTMMIAILLVSAVIFGDGENIKDRFALGKEVFTVLISVLGTVIGFYYGSTLKAPITPSSNIQMATVKITPEQPQAGTPVNFTTLVTGGEKPYLYSIKFYKDVIQPVVNQPSNDGKISQDISIPETVPPGDLSFQIEVKDAKGDVYIYNKDGQQTFKVQARPPTP